MALVIDSSLVSVLPMQDEVLAGKRVPLTEAEITVLKRGLSDYAARVKGQR